MANVFQRQSAVLVVQVTVTARGAEGDEHEGPVPIDSNVLPKTASRDERDVHWFFNFAEGEISPSARYSISERTLLRARCSSLENHHEEHGPTDVQLVAIGRARRIFQALGAIGNEDARVLQVWSARPLAFSEPVRRTLGRTSGVALRLAARHNGRDVLVAACESVHRGEADELARRRVTRALAEAEAVTARAFAEYAVARGAIDREAARANEAREMGAFEKALRGGR